MAENAPCDCGRDYLTVPLDVAHRCPQPRITWAACRTFAERFGRWPSYSEPLRIAA